MITPASTGGICFLPSLRDESSALLNPTKIRLSHQKPEEISKYRSRTYHSLCKGPWGQGFCFTDSCSRPALLFHEQSWEDSPAPRPALPQASLTKSHRTPLCSALLQRPAWVGLRVWELSWRSAATQRAADTLLVGQAL